MNRTLPVFLTLLLVFGVGCIARPVTDDGNSGPAPTRPAESFRIDGLLGVVTQVDPERLLASVRLPEAIEEVMFPPGDALTSDDVGMLVRVSGERDPSTRRILADTIETIDGPNLVVTAPVPGATVTSPLIVFGFGRVFEQSFAWRVRDASGAKVVEGIAQTDAAQAGHFGPFRFDIVLPAMPGREFSLEVFWHSPRNGSEMDLIAVPLLLLSDETTTFDVYFQRTGARTAAECADAVPVKREVAKTSAVARAALEALLDGPTSDERASGLVSVIPRFTDLRSVAIQEGTASADFSSTLSTAATGNCVAAGIREQIARTLLQFDSVEAVEVLADGKPNNRFSLE